MWTIKHRPQKLENVVGNQEIIRSIKGMMPEISHLLLYGMPGTGKTTTAHCIVNELGCDFKEINASDDRGIETVRTVIKNFANTSSLTGKFKIIILDEFDATTPDFQTALRRLMEMYGTNCRFILTANNFANIIEPIKSRCSGGTFEFKSIEYDEFKRGILNILSKESMLIDENALLKLHELSGGDMRIIDKLYQISFSTKNITLSDIMVIKNDDSWCELYKLIKESKYIDACKFSKKEQIVPMFHAILADDLLTVDQKMLITKYVAEWDYRSHFAQTDYIQIYGLIANIISTLKKTIQKPDNIAKTANIFGINKV